MKIYKLNEVIKFDLELLLVKITYSTVPTLLGRKRKYYKQKF